jgi:hypothetical protein
MGLSGIRFDLPCRPGGEIRSWDDVFGGPWEQEGPRAQQRAVRTQSRKWEVWKLVHALHEGEGKPPIDNVLFERVGKELGIGGKSTVAALYTGVARTRTIGLKAKGFLLPGAPIHRPVMLSDLSTMRKYPIGEKDQVHGLPTSIRYNQSIKSVHLGGCPIRRQRCVNDIEGAIVPAPSRSARG